MEEILDTKKDQDSTVTARVAAIQVKMLHLQFRMRKIYLDQKALNEKLPSFKGNRKIIKGMNNAVYNCIDMLVTMEHLFQLIADIFATSELREHFTNDIYKILNETKKITKKWKAVRNKLGGHIDIEIAEKFCEQHNYKGVFITDDLETDLSALNMLLIESAVNTARKSEDILGRDLNLKQKGIANEMKLFVEKLNKDWEVAFSYFEPMMKFMYKIGKQEKMECTDPSDWKGIIVD